jgi:hypothetical protein
VITGTLPTVCYGEGMTRFLYAHEIGVFDYLEFASMLRDRVRAAHSAEFAAQAGTEIEHIAKSHVRKEEGVAEVLEERGEHPGQDFGPGERTPEDLAGAGIFVVGKPRPSEPWP